MTLNDDRVWACSTPLDGEYGYREVALGVPVKMGSEGVKGIVEFGLTPEEQEALNVSAEVIREQIKRGKAFLKKKNS